MAMKQCIESCAIGRYQGRRSQNVGATVDFEILSLPGGSLIAILLGLTRPQRVPLDARPRYEFAATAPARIRRGLRIASGSGRAQHENRE